MGDWKAVQLNVGLNPDRPIELYHLKQDPGEQKDVAAQNPQVVKQIQTIMKEAHSPSDRFKFEGGGGKKRGKKKGKK